MIDFLVSILEANINFQTVGAFILLYFFSIWVLLCFWVFIDAKRRYEKNPVAIFFFFVVLIFNFPGLIFYLIIRPDLNEDHFLYLQNNEVISDSEKKGVEVPIVNFIGEDGSVNLSFQLRINKAVANNVQIGASVDSNVPDIVQVNVGQPLLNTAQNQPRVASMAPKSDQPSVSVESVDLSKNESKSFKVNLNPLKNNFKNVRAAFVKNAKQPEAIEISVDSQNPINSSPSTIEVKEAEIITPQEQNKPRKDKKKKKHRRR